MPGAKVIEMYSKLCVRSAQSIIVGDNRLLREMCYEECLVQNIVSGFGHRHKDLIDLVQ